MDSKRDKTHLVQQQKSNLMKKKKSDKMIKIKLNDSNISNFSTPLLGLMYNESVSLNDIQELNLSNNLLSSIPNLSDLKNLKSLNISNNRISSIKGMVVSNSLEQLDLSKNHISSLFERNQKGEVVSYLQDLKLNLSSNKLDDISEFKKLDCKLKKLQILDISFNDIDEKYGQKCIEFIQKYFHQNMVIKINSKNESKTSRKQQQQQSEIIPINTTNNVKTLTKNNPLTLSLQNLKSQILNPNKIYQNIFKEEEEYEQEEKEIKKRTQRNVTISSYSLEREDKLISQLQRPPIQSIPSNQQPSSQQYQPKILLQQQNQNQQSQLPNNNVRHKRIHSAYIPQPSLHPKKDQQNQNNLTTNSSILNNSKSFSSYLLHTVQEIPHIQKQIIYNEDIKQNQIQDKNEDFKQNEMNKQQFVDENWKLQDNQGKQNQIKQQQDQILQSQKQVDQAAVISFQTPIRRHSRITSAPLYPADLKQKFHSSTSLSSVKIQNQSIETSPFELPFLQSSNLKDQKGDHGETYQQSRDYFSESSTKQTHQCIGNNSTNNNLQQSHSNSLSTSQPIKNKSEQQIEHTSSGEFKLENVQTKKINDIRKEVIVSECKNSNLNSKIQFTSILCQILHQYVFKNDPSFSLAKLEECYQANKLMFQNNLAMHLGMIDFKRSNQNDNNNNNLDFFFNQ